MVQEEQSSAVVPTMVITVAAALMAVGLVMVASARAPFDRSILDVSLWRAILGRQALFLLIGFVIMLATARVAPALLASPLIRRRATQVFFVLVMVFLVAALIPGIGSAQRGSHRWLPVAPDWTGLRFQPSEPAKLALVAFLAWLLGGRPVDPRSFKAAFAPATIAIALAVTLVGKADFGTSALLAGIGTLMLFVAGCRWRHLVLLVMVGACGMVGLLYAAPYRLARIAAYRDVWADPRGAGYQPLQSLTAIASGGWFGKGLGAGVQKYGYLPESHSDFIFSVICEEAGLCGAAVVIALFGALTWLGLQTIWRARSRFERLLAFGITTTIGLQAVMNIAVVTVVTPTTGIALPLVSAGGSGVLTCCLAIGLVAAIATRGHQVEVERYNSDECGSLDWRRVSIPEGGVW